MKNFMAVKLWTGPVENSFKKLDSRFTLIRFGFEIESNNDSQMSESWFIYLIFDSIWFWFTADHDSRVNRDSRRINIKPNQNELNQFESQIKMNCESKWIRIKNKMIHFGESKWIDSVRALIATLNSHNFCAVCTCKIDLIWMLNMCALYFLIFTLYNRFHILSLSYLDRQSSFRLFC